MSLAIDARLQYLAFRELKAAVELHKAKAGGLVILDAQTGEILALANWPTYNPNARNRVARERMRNRALTDVFEPGSTLKPFTIAAALESGAVRPDTVIQTAPGSLTLGPNTIHDAHPHGALTVEQVIQKSSNVGAAKIALSLPSATLWQMLSDSGFGTAPNTGFPGEVAGRLRPAKTWKPIEQATMAYGHGISVNLVQLARAYTVFASDGELKPASLLKGGGAVAGRPVLKAETARAVRHMLELAVGPGGTAPKAQVPGYRVAGKTGTAHKLEGRGYTNKYVSSFVGFAPVSGPRLIVAVMIDEPSAGAHYGGEVAAPVFSTVMGSALRTLGTPPDAPGDNVILPPEGSAGARGNVMAAALAPDFDAVALLARLGGARRAGSRPTAGRCARATRSPRSRASWPMAARSSPTPSRAAPARCCGRRSPFAGMPRGASPMSRSTISRRSSARSPITIYGRPSHDALGHRRHRNERQDVVHALDRAVPRCLRPEERDHRHARQRTRRRARSLGAHDAGRRGGPRDARPAARRGRAGGGHGSLVARARSGARQRGRIRRRAVHEPHPGPPRLSRDDGGLRRGEGEAVLLADASRLRAQCGRSVRPQRSPTRRAAAGSGC